MAPAFFDPDRRWFSPDKFQHAVGGFLLTAALMLFIGPLQALGTTFLVSIAWELAQWDALRGIALSPLGQVGYGFGVRDLIADVVGAWAALVLLAATPATVHHAYSREAIPEPASAESLWTYIQRCSGNVPRPGHGLHDVAWAKDSLILYAPNHDLMGMWVWRDVYPDGPGPDTIVLDVWHQTLAINIAHELEHHLEARYDTLHAHPEHPWVTPCHLIIRPSYAPAAQH